MYSPKRDKEPGVAGFKANKTISDRFAAATEYQNYHVLEKSSRFDEDVAQKFHKARKMIAVEVNNCAFFQKDPTEVIAILQEFR